MKRLALLVVVAALTGCERPSAPVEPAAQATPTPTVEPALEAGASADAIVVTLNVEGMHCGGCASGIEAALVSIDGVRACTVSYDEKIARIEVDDADRAESLVGIIENLGYEVTPAG